MFQILNEVDVWLYENEKSTLGCFRAMVFMDSCYFKRTMCLQSWLPWQSFTHDLDSTAVPPWQNLPVLDGVGLSQIRWRFCSPWPQFDEQGDQGDQLPQPPSTTETDPENNNRTKPNARHSFRANLFQDQRRRVQEYSFEGEFCPAFPFCLATPLPCGLMRFVKII